MNIRRPIAFVATSAATVAVMSIAGLLATGTAHGAITPARCYSQNLKLSLGPPTGAAGTTYYHLRFTNEGTAACLMYGYPGASARTSPAGPRIGHAATREPADPALVVLAPGGTAHAVLGIGTASDYPASRCHPVEAGAVGVYPPGAVLRLAARLDFEACARRAVHLLTITTVVPGG